MNTEKIIEELERENAFLRHEIWMDGENRLQIRKYLDEQGQNRAVSEVIADRVEFIERKEKTLIRKILRQETGLKAWAMMDC